MRMRMRRRRYPSPPNSLILQPRKRREVEMVASGEPERTGCGYGDIVMVAIMEESPLGRRASWRGPVRAAEEWATTVDDAAAWSDVAPANGTEAP